MYRIVASDLDETLLDDTHHVPERGRRAIAAARDGAPRKLGGRHPGGDRTLRKPR